jgi:hypothetical protein
LKINQLHIKNKNILKIVTKKLGNMSSFTYLYGIRVEGIPLPQTKTLWCKGNQTKIMSTTTQKISSNLGGMINYTSKEVNKMYQTLLTELSPYGFEEDVMVWGAGMSEHYTYGVTNKSTNLSVWIDDCGEEPFYAIEDINGDYEHIELSNFIINLNK